jgi:pyrimidine deaminase RibD-like protein
MREQELQAKESRSASHHGRTVPCFKKVMNLKVAAISCMAVWRRSTDASQRHDGRLTVTETAN